MKFARFEVKNEVKFGVISENEVKVIKGDIFADWEYTGESFTEAEIKLLAPIEPKNVIGIGANFVSKVEERPTELPEIPVFFFKPTTSVVGTEEDVVIPEGIEEVKFESELAVVIGKEAKNISTDEVLDHIFGYTVANDITAPQFFHQDGHWTVGKAFDTFTPLGPVIETELDPAVVRIKAEINGEERQNSPTELMIVPLKEMISYLSKVMTLQPGDVILTGSPLGAHLIGNGDVVECKIDEIGTLKNTAVKLKTPIKS
jgi:2-keto-4-pentenoate hydratase/2-oxohepta-3-ene-1,7-dioic acid hydratase in catechol pathway